MKVDLKKYDASKKIAQNWYLKRKGVSLGLAIATISAMMNIPIIVVAYWIGDLTDWPDEVVQSIDGYIKFYKYTNILNKPENSPI